MGGSDIQQRGSHNYYTGRVFDKFFPEVGTKITWNYTLQRRGRDSAPRRPKTAQDGLKMAQDCPRWPSQDLNTAPRWPKTGLRQPQVFFLEKKSCAGGPRGFAA